MSTKFKIGSIVALNTHPFLSNLTNIKIEGEPQAISPIMTISELIRDSQNLYDENSGFQVQEKGESFQCKCIWFSTKSYLLHTEWFSSKLLKILADYEYEPHTEELTDKNSLYGCQVAINTSFFELIKEKRSTKTEDSIIKKTQNPLLNFSSPLMQVIGSQTDIKNEPKFDQKNGKQKKEITRKSVKCKWFNPISEKFSESFFPVECLVLIKNINQDILHRVNELIANKETVKIQIKQKETLFTPQTITFIHGKYSMSGFNFVANSISDIDLYELTLNDLSNLNPVLKISPDFASGFNIDLIEDLELKINEARTNNHYIVIRYKDRFDNVTIRSIKDIKEILVQENENTFKFSPTLEPSKYLIGFCMLRNEERHFKLDRIEFLKILNLKYS